jgi:TonB family protein
VIAAVAAPAMDDGLAVDEGEQPGRDIGPRGRALEMAGRVVASELDAGETGAARGLPYVSIAEATGRRTYDFFPRLPLSSWDGRGPYTVVIDLCVSPEGRVSEAVLLSGKAATLDRQVLRAVRTWRYRARPDGFCHVVTIRYEL